MNDYIFGFERLQAFITGRRLVKAIYDCQKKFPAAEKYALGDQIRRASVSITSNIAEGMGRIFHRKSKFTSLKLHTVRLWKPIANCS